MHEVSAAPLTPEEARDLTERINRTAGDLWRLLLESYEREAWRALGYESWRAYATGEFSMSQSRAYQLLSHGELVNALAAETNGTVSTTVEKLPERATREIRTVPEDRRAEAVTEAVETAPAKDGEPKVTTRHAAEIAKKYRDDPPPEAEDYDPEDDAPDPQAEWERAERENERLRELVEQLESSDKDTEIRKLSARASGLEGRLQQCIATQNEAKRTAKYAQGMLRKIREALGVERDREIMGAIQGLQR